MSGFDIAWLDLRESADRRARDAALLERAGRWLRAANNAQEAMTVVDLGAGTGATLRAFAELSDTRVQFPAWRLVDHDATLLSEALRRHASTWRLETVQQDLTDIAALPLTGARLVTASALFDLASADFVDALAAALDRQCRRHPVGFYAALNYDGATHWTPIHPLDAAVLAAFNRDQRRDKGLGPALGPAAGTYLEQVFTELGFTVFAASTPWVLGAQEQQLTNALIDGISAAVAGDPELDRAQLHEWAEFRRHHTGTGSCRVGHRDILALPADLPH